VIQFRAITDFAVLANHEFPAGSSLLEPGGGGDPGHRLWPGDPDAGNPVANSPPAGQTPQTWLWPLLLSRLSYLLSALVSRVLSCPGMALTLRPSSWRACRRHQVHGFDRAPRLPARCCGRSGHGDPRGSAGAGAGQMRTEGAHAPWRLPRTDQRWR
jgi:hypothetical protein